ncbi:MAG: response regulator [Lachnospiraceae bacterium]|nr:response regulator [Lachnospiraceae bacterium]
MEKKVKILIVDDSEFSSKIMKDTLENNGFEVVSIANDGETAIEKFKKYSPDLTIMDIILPGIDGLSAAETILSENKDARIIMVSSLCDRDTLKEVQNIGLSLLLPKPCEDELLMSSIELALNK